MASALPSPTQTIANRPVDIAQANPPHLGIIALADHRGDSRGPLADRDIHVSTAFTQEIVPLTSWALPSMVTVAAPAPL